jgi:hypothetical protein
VIQCQWLFNFKIKVVFLGCVFLPQNTTEYHRTLKILLNLIKYVKKNVIEGIFKYRGGRFCFLQRYFTTVIKILFLYFIKHLDDKLLSGLKKTRRNGYD